MFDAPLQSQMQRAKGTARLGFAEKDGRSKLVDLYQAGCLKLMMPNVHSDLPDAVLINTAGGLTGGDRLKASTTVGDGASLRLATQTAERIYRSTGDCAKVAFDFQVGARARFDWLAQETILFDGGRVKRSIRLDMETDASVLLVEPIVLGRQAMGETVEHGLLHDSWRIRRGGKLIFADATRLSDFAALKQPASLNGATSLASILFVDPLAGVLRDRVLPYLGAGGASSWNDLLFIRLLDEEPRLMRKRIKEILKILRQEDLPRVWTM